MKIRKRLYLSIVATSTLMALFIGAVYLGVSSTYEAHERYRQVRWLNEAIGRLEVASADLLMSGSTDRAKDWTERFTDATERAASFRGESAAASRVEADLAALGAFLTSVSETL